MAETRRYDGPVSDYDWEERPTNRTVANVIELAAALVGMDELAYQPEGYLEQALDERWGITLEDFESIVFALLKFTFPHKGPELLGEGMRQTFGIISDAGDEYFELVGQTWEPKDAEERRMES